MTGILRAALAPIASLLLLWALFLPTLDLPAERLLASIFGRPRWRWR